MIKKRKSIGGGPEDMFHPLTSLVSIARENPRTIEAAYQLARRTPELKCLPNKPFMTRDEFERACEQSNAILRVAQIDAETIGFALVLVDDIDSAEQKSACLVYLVVAPKHRRKGIAALLIKDVIQSLEVWDTKVLYAWAHPTSGITELLKKAKFKKGHPRVYMEQEL